VTCRHPAFLDGTLTATCAGGQWTHLRGVPCQPISAWGHAMGEGGWASEEKSSWHGVGQHREASCLQLR
jgi:hypothetical protein